MVVFSAFEAKLTQQQQQQENKPNTASKSTPTATITTTSTTTSTTSLQGGGSVKRKADAIETTPKKQSKKKKKDNSSKPSSKADTAQNSQVEFFFGFPFYNFNHDKQNIFFSIISSRCNQCRLTQYSWFCCPSTRELIWRKIFLLKMLFD